MERRVFTAIVLSFLVLFFYQTFFAPPPPKTPPANAAKGSAPAASAANPSASASVAPAPAPEPPAESTPAAAAVVSEASDRTIVVDTTTVQAVFTNRGGRLLHWRLKDYFNANGARVDLVPANLPPVEQLPFSLRVDDPATTVRLNNSVYRVTGDEGGHVDATHGSATLAFEYEDAAGLHVRKQFDFSPANYIVRFTATLMNGEKTINPSVVWGPALGDVTPTASAPGFFNRSAQPPPEAILHRSGKVERISITTLPNQPVQEADFRFVGVDTHYFMMAAVNPGRYGPTIARSSCLDPTTRGGSSSRRRSSSAAARRTSGTSSDPSNSICCGRPTPRWSARSTSACSRSSSCRCCSSLKWIHGYVGNYGWSIVVLTLLINLVIFPLRHKSVVSMRKMQEIQPQLKAIQDRYSKLKATDPARAEDEHGDDGALREKGVNPASGCMPMLLHDAGALRVLCAAWRRDRAARRAVHRLDSRPVRARSVLRDSRFSMGADKFWQQRIMPTTAPIRRSRR